MLIALRVGKLDYGRARRRERTLGTVFGGDGRLRVRPALEQHHGAALGLAGVQVLQQRGVAQRAVAREVRVHLVLRHLVAQAADKHLGLRAHRVDLLLLARPLLSHFRAVALARALGWLEMVRREAARGEEFRGEKQRPGRVPTRRARFKNASPQIKKRGPSHWGGS